MIAFNSGLLIGYKVFFKGNCMKFNRIGKMFSKGFLFYLNRLINKFPKCSGYIDLLNIRRIEKVDYEYLMNKFKI